MPKYCYIKVSNDEYRHIVAIGDTMRELADQVGVSPMAIELGLSRGSQQYERVLLEDDDMEYKRHTCKECLHLNNKKKIKQGYACDSKDKTWNVGNQGVRKASDQCCRWFEYNEN